LLSKDNLEYFLTKVKFYVLKNKKELSVNHHKLFSTFIFATTLINLPIKAEQLNTSMVKELEFLEATIKVRIDPKYPSQAVRQGKEGWVKMSYVISAEGRVQDIEILDSSGDYGFKKEARRALKKWKYSPAIENDKPIESCNTTIQFDFSMAHKASKKYLAQYDKTSDFLEKNDLPELEKNIEILKSFTNNNDEEIRTNLLLGQYGELIKDKKIQFHAYSRVKSVSGPSLVNSIKTPVYQRLYTLYLEKNMIKKALKISDEILKIDDAKAIHEQMTNHKLKVEQYINSQKPIVISADIEKRTNWQHSLVRDAFSINDIDGRLTKLEIRCANKRKAFTIEEKTTWQIPSSWQECSVLVFGEDDTTFKLVEEPQLLSKNNN